VYRAFEDEDRTLQQLINSSNCPPNIMASICSIVCRLPYAASIFSPPAICDLHEYITNDDNKPSSASGRLRHVREILGVREALEWLAKNLAFEKDNDQYAGKSYHYLDLRPENILVCEYHNGAVSFKIGDFAQALQLPNVIRREGNTRQQH
jgi:hypothetical protein